MPFSKLKVYLTLPFKKAGNQIDTFREIYEATVEEISPSYLSKALHISFAGYFLTVKSGGGGGGQLAQIWVGMCPGRTKK